MRSKLRKGRGANKDFGSVVEDGILRAAIFMVLEISSLSFSEDVPVFPIYRIINDHKLSFSIHIVVVS